MILTDKYRQKIAMACGSGTLLPNITDVAFGDGGTEMGSIRGETGAETGLYHEVLRKNVSVAEFLNDGKTICYKVPIEKAELNDKAISEIGLFDSTGELVAIDFCEPQKKDAELKYIFEININL